MIAKDATMRRMRLLELQVAMEQAIKEKDFDQLEAEIDRAKDEFGLRTACKLEEDARRDALKIH